MSESVSTTAGPTRLSLTSPTTLGLALAALLAGWGQPLLFVLPGSFQALLAIALLVWAPGYTIAAVAGIDGSLFFVMVTIAVSLSLNVAVAMSLLYLELWGIVAFVAVMGVITFTFAVIALFRRWNR